MKKLQRIKNSGIPDILDNFARKNAPPISERTFETPEESAPVLERLCPEKIRAQLRELTTDFEDGVTYRARTSVGHAEDGTKHPHDFVIEKMGGTTSFYFVDPEHFVGQRNMRRPSISNLMTLRLKSDSSDLPEIAITRFRTKSLADSNITELKMEKQLGHARTLIQSRGVPVFLENNPQEVTFRTVVTPKEALAQSRYVGESDLETFLRGADSAWALEGKLVSQQAILKSFVQLLQNGEFERVKEKRLTA